MHHHMFKGRIRRFHNIGRPGSWLVPDARLQDAATEKTREGLQQSFRNVCLDCSSCTSWPSCSLAQLAADNRTGTTGAGQTEPGLSALPRKSSSGRNSSCSFPPAEATPMACSISQQRSGGPRGTVPVRAVRGGGQTSQAPGSRGCTSLAFKSGDSTFIQVQTQDFPSLPLHAAILQAKQTPCLLQLFQHFSFCQGTKFRWGQLNWHLVPCYRPRHSH